MSLKKDSNNRVIVPEGELYFEKIGNGDPVILIHAGFSDRRDWMHQIEDFGIKYNTIVYDQRGSGNSSTITTTFAPAEDLKAIINHIEIEKTILIGHSIGGTIALDFALQYPNNVSALVLIASGLNGYTWSKEYLEFMQSIWSVHQPEKMTNLAKASLFRAAMLEKVIRLTEVLSASLRGKPQRFLSLN